MQTTTWSKCTWKISDSLGVMASETSAGQVSFAEVSWSMQQLFAERLNNRLKLLFRSFQRKPLSGLGFGASQLVVLDTPSVHMLHWKDLGCPTAVPTQEADSQRLVAIDPSSLLIDCTQVALLIVRRHCFKIGCSSMQQYALPTICADCTAALNLLWCGWTLGSPTTKSHGSQDIKTRQGVTNSL